MSKALERLSTRTRAKLRSTLILSSLPQIVSELVQNSLDAGARKVEIGLNCEEWTFWVKDNGSGISKDGLETLGKGDDNGRYSEQTCLFYSPKVSDISDTSKIYAPGAPNVLSTFGFRGEALASAAELSCLEISSRTDAARDTWSIILKGGKTLYNGPAVRWRRHSAGTVVCIRDAFYNIPVRRLSHPSPARTWELVRKEIETYALVFPHVLFTLEDTHRSDEMAGSRERILKIPQTPSTLSSFRHIYGRALAEHVEEIAVECGPRRADGFISVNGAHSKAYQFLYINRHPILPCDLHRVIEARFASSSFSKNALDEGGETGLPRPTIRRSPRKAEKKPVYVLNITIPPDEIDNYVEPAKTAVQFQDRFSVLSFLSSIIDSFLRNQGFISEHQEADPDQDNFSPSPRKRRKLDEYTHIQEQVDNEPTLSSHDHANRLNTETEPVGIYTNTNANSPEVVWTDSNTGENFIVDTRTGNSYKQQQQQPCHTGQRTQTSFINRRTIEPQGARSGDDVPSWLQQALQANKAYSVPEPHIPSLMIAPIDFVLPTHPHSHSSSLKQTVCQTFLTGLPNIGSDNYAHRFGKEALRRAQVINQVDRKFIACLISAGPDTEPEEVTNGEADEEVKGASTRALVLVDQHAADERIRVERFLKELCLGFLHNRACGEDPANGIKGKELTPPKPVLLTQHEARMLEGSKEIELAFRHWGIIFLDPLTNVFEDSKITSGTGDASGYAQVLVQSIPEVVSDKLLQGDELKDLIKGFLGQLEVDPSSTSRSLPSDDIHELDWLKALRWCPQGLLDLINSKACRGAIMFNDTLNIDQCERLIAQLSWTAFPFQCAHGRPSLVPLTNIKSHSEGLRRRCNWEGWKQ
ncbi:hypothetical protein BDQ12DRAFT_731752 [Crucibulum laeve]|uniref:MutL C-terminal dimerisation domain-containing protein n=1 Tax=Crucibulum laeve TaxID=68775 RepID=A0A5C3MEV7_9AGAR|nr:hypothetical protein BDQ12DRAFT_731752 [Crucibulum laeve]